MDEFTAEDLESYTVKVTPIELLGKQAYVRGLTLDGQEAIAKAFGGKENQEATVADLRLMLACLLCDSEGNLLFSDFSKGAKLLAKLDHEELMGLIEKSNQTNGQDIEHEKKVLNLNP